MFGLKKRARLQAAMYLDVIRPWAMGVDNRGWRNEDFFETPANLDAPREEWVPKKDIYDYRTDPSQTIFPLLTYQFTLLDRLFMDARLYNALLHLNQGISNFNAMLAAFAAAPTVNQRWNTVVMLHTGLIGTAQSGGLYERWMRAWAAATE